MQNCGMGETELYNSTKRKAGIGTTLTTHKNCVTIIMPSARVDAKNSLGKKRGSISGVIQVVGSG